MLVKSSGEAQTNTNRYRKAQKTRKKRTRAQAITVKHRKSTGKHSEAQREQRQAQESIKTHRKSTESPDSAGKLGKVQEGTDKASKKHRKKWRSIINKERLSKSKETESMRIIIENINSKADLPRLQRNNSGRKGN